MALDSLRDHNYSHLDLETLRYHLENITSMCSTCAVYGDSILPNVTALSPSPCCAYSLVSKTVIYVQHLLTLYILLSSALCFFAGGALDSSSLES